jgi:hypothetical protein
MPTIKTLTGVQYMLPVPKPVPFHVRIHINEANDFTYTLSRQQTGETPARKSADCAPLYKLYSAATDV